MAGLALVWDLIAHDSASPTFNKVAASADRAAASTGKADASVAGFGKKAAAALGALVAIDIGVHIVSEAAKFQKSMLLIQTQAGASAAEVKKMSAAVLDMAGSVGTSPEKLADSIYHIESAGLRGQRAIDTMRIAAEGAKVGNADLTETTNALTSAVVSGIPGVQNMSQAMGALNAIVGAGDMRLGDLNDALSTGVLKVAKTFGLSLSDVGAALADFGDNNIRGAHAATTFRVAFEAMAHPVAGGAEQLKKLGLTSDQLATDMQKGGLIPALQDLKTHLTAAGITGTKTGEVLLNAFGKKAGPGVTIMLDDLNRIIGKSKLIQTSAQNFGDAWKATTKTASFALESVGATVESIGIRIGTAILPAIGGIAHGFTDALNFLKPMGDYVGGVLVTAWHLLATAVSAVGTVLAPVAHLLGGLAGPIGATATAIAALWVGMKAGQTVAAGLTAVFGRGGFLDGVRLQAMYAADGVRTMGTSFRTAAVDATASATVIEGEAAATAGAVVASGDAARVGWAGLAGPIGAVAVGVLALVSIFHKSSTASKEATAAAKAYTDALESGSGYGNLLDTVTKQLTDNHLPELLNDLNKQLGATKFTGGEFAAAILGGVKPTDALRSRLEAVIKAGTSYQTVQRGYATVTKQYLTPAAEDATKALGHLNTQYSSLSKAAAKDLADTKSFAGVSSSVDKIAAATQVATGTATQYLGVVGLIADKNGIVAASNATVTAALKTVTHAYDTATETGSAFLSSLQQFSSSAGDASDRAAIIGATLKAANGDALNFATQMNAAATASKQFFTDVKSNATASFGLKDAKGVLHDTADANRAYLKSIIDLKTGTIDYGKTAATPFISDLSAMQTGAMNAAQATFQQARATMSGKQAADQAYKVYRNQTSVALTDQLKKLGLNSAAAKRVADQYFGMPKDVKTLIEQEGKDSVLSALNEIGQQLALLTGKPWKSILTADGSPAKKEAADTTAKIAAIKQRVIPKVTVNTGQAKDDLETVNSLVAGLHDKTITIRTITPDSLPQDPNKGGRILGWAGGTGSGGINSGTFTMGERGWELGSLSGGKLRIWSHEDSMRLTGKPDRLPGFAGGTQLMRWVEQGGFRGRAAEQAYALAMGESGGNPRAYNGNTATGDNSYGLMQINMIGSLGPSRLRQFGLRSASQLLDPVTNMHAAYILSNHGTDFGAWGLGPNAYRDNSRGQVDGWTRFASQAAQALKAVGGNVGSGGDLSSSGGSTGKNKPTYDVGGKLYTTLLGARNHARETMNTAVKLTTKIDTTDLQRFGKDVHGTVAQAKSAFLSLSNDVNKMHVTAHFDKVLKAQDKSLNKLILFRNITTGKLKSLQATMKQLSTSVRDAIIGSFDITSAGANPVTGKITGAGILAQQAQQLGKIRLFGAGLKKLEQRHLVPSYLMELAAKGPDALPEVQALLSLPNLKTVDANAVAIKNAASSYGTSVANTVYGSAQKTLEAEDAHYTKLTNRLAKVMAHEVERAANKYENRPIVIQVDGKTVWTVVRREEAKAKRR